MIAAVSPNRLLRYFFVNGKGDDGFLRRKRVFIDRVSHAVGTRPIAVVPEEKAVCAADGNRCRRVVQKQPVIAKQRLAFAAAQLVAIEIDVVCQIERIARDAAGAAAIGDAVHFVQ